MSREWRLYLADMKEFASRVVEYRGTLNREQLESSRLHYDAVLRNIELIGEAARNLPSEVRVAAPDVPWSAIVSVRNILAHAYFGVDKDAIWDVIDAEIPLLLESLAKLEQRLDSEAD